MSMDINSPEMVITSHLSISGMKDLFKLLIIRCLLRSSGIKEVSVYIPPDAFILLLTYISEPRCSTACSYYYYYTYIKPKKC